MSSEAYHEREDVLSDAAKDLHRALVSLKEELDAVDWYQQRAEACVDADLRAVLLHNKNEEIEHAMMVLEWIRRRDPAFDANVSRYLRSTGSIVQVEGGAAPAAERAASSSLGVGSLKGAR